MARHEVIHRFLSEYPEAGLPDEGEIAEWMCEHIPKPGNNDSTADPEVSAVVGCIDSSWALPIICDHGIRSVIDVSIRVQSIRGG